MTTRHTLGEWYVDKDSDGGAFDVRVLVNAPHPTRWGIATIWHQSGGRSLGEEDEANARLISAAPELLEMVHHFEAYLLGDGCAEEHDLVRSVRAAIAKAEGKSNG